jgi:hypothetical protein
VIDDARRRQRRQRLMASLILLIAGAVAVLAARGTGPPTPSTINGHLAGTGSSSQFPKSSYPPAVRARARGALSACPNPAGLDRFDSKSRESAARIAARYDRNSESVDLHDSDRAWWPQVRQMWRSRKPGKGVVNQEVYGSHPASTIAYAVIIRYSCGSRLPAKSLSIGIGPRQTQPPYCDACVSTLFFVDHRGHPLIYYLY